MPDPADFKPRYAIVTGGSAGIGRATCIALADTLGVDIAFTYHSGEDDAKETANAVEKARKRAIYRKADHSDLKAGVDVIDELADELGGVDILIANAGAANKGSILEMSVEDWQQTVALCLSGAFFTMQRAAQRMVKQGTGGRLIAITSVHEREPQPDSAPYVAAKHGLGGVVKNMALELTPRHGITVNAIAPGEINVKQEGMGAYVDKSDEAIRQIKRPAIPVGRPGYPREVADVVCFLAGPASSYVTGSSWRVDGGFEVMTPLASGEYRKDYLPKV